MSGVYTFQSGLPFSVSSTTGGGLAGLTGSVTVRGDLLPCSNMVPSGSAQQNLNGYVNPACFAPVGNVPSGAVLTGLSPQQGSGSGSYTVGGNGVSGDSGIGTLFGSSGRNILRGPAESRFDLSLTKTFPIHEAVNLTFRAEAFKVFNNPIFSNPQSNISNSTFGKITSTIDSTGRILQLALKLNF
jgi:hypothetical protein